MGEKLGENQKTIQKSSEKSSEKILRIIKENNEISAEEVAGKLGLSSRAVEKQIAGLKKKGLLKRAGPDKGGHWEAVE
ncbi:MAG: winged helix-turn-helix transcriptional regulator [Candidatus Nanoarchaeia archaeon]|nr:winged helix-turn-helix transcriptional regulator [Candidatus Nanoarchaeia archaeon]